MKVTIVNAVDGRRLAKAVFGPEVPNPARQADVEVIFQVKRADAVHLDGEPYAVIGPLSCTLVDTRESYTLSAEQMDAVTTACLIAAAEDDGLEWQ